MAFSSISKKSEPSLLHKILLRDEDPNDTAEALAGLCCEKLQRGETVNLEDYLAHPALKEESATAEFLSIVNMFRLFSVQETVARCDDANSSTPDLVTTQ